MPLSISLRKLEASEDQIIGNIFEIFKFSLKSGKNPFSIFQPSPCIILAEMEDELVGFAQVARIGSGYLYLKQDFELKNAMASKNTDGVRESCIYEAVSSVPKGNRIWAVVPTNDVNLYRTTGSFAEVSIKEAISYLWPSALFFGSPLFLSSVLFSAFFVGNSFTSFFENTSVLNSNEEILHFTNFFSQIPLFTFLIIPPIAFAMNVFLFSVGKSILRTEGQNKR